MKRIKRRKQKGAALLVVLFIVMAVTILSLGFLSRSDVELACGENMILRTQMDYLAESGLEHTKGLILNPQDVSSEYWQGGVGQQLYSGDDYYDVNVTRREPCDGPTYRCNYEITCEAYRNRNGEKVGRSALRAELRLDPCIALWIGKDMTVSGAMTVNGDLYCNGILTNYGAINGDVFANGFSGNEPLGQQKPLADLSLQWPQVTVEDFTSRYTVQSIDSILSDVTYGPYNPVRVCYRGSGNVELNSNVQIYGMLAVEGNLTIRGDGNVITAGKNLPALLVTGNLKVENGGGLDIDGLAIVEGEVQISAGPANLNIIGGLFTNDGIVETTADSSGNDNTATLYNCPTWQPSGQVGGALEFDGIDDYVQTSDDPNKLQLTGDYTMAVWIKADVTQKDWAAIFSKCNTDGSVNHWTLQFDNVSPKKLIIHQPTASWDTGIVLGEVAGAWHHIRVVRSGNMMTSYLDGNEMHSNMWNVNPGSGTGHLNIGVDRTALPSHVYEGLIDDIRVYDCAPDANETYPSVNPVGHWELDEAGSGNISITAAPSKTAIVVRPEAGVTEKWGQAAGAFFRSIERK